jgi:DNA (cytosine-5)-methyltransferase 1
MMAVPETRHAREPKLRRLHEGGVPRVLELCSGSGGLSLGLKRAGFDLTAHVELDAAAAKTYAQNFAPSCTLSSPWAVARNMELCSAEQLVYELHLGSRAESAFDVLVAGLPCQAFARIGRSKLREIAGKENAFRVDPRATLYHRFLRFVLDTQPVAVLIENVPDILNFGGHNIPEEICDHLEAAGYITAYTILNAAHYGVPQIRERVFIVGITRELNVRPIFPEPSHYLSLPKGYLGSRKVAMRFVSPRSAHFAPIHVPSPELPPAVNVEQALRDLPAIREHLSNPLEMRRRRVGDFAPYSDNENLSTYAVRMRNWPGFGTQKVVDGNVVRLTPRDFPIFELMPANTDYPQALRIAEELLRAELERRGLSVDDPMSDEHVEVRASIVPPYDPRKFPNKWWKMDPAKPSRTLTAHMGQDTYSHIHYDSSQKRTVSVREAARLQSFPDGFSFSGAMNPAFRQIGNAVPPLLGFAVAQALREQIIAAVRGEFTPNGQHAA